MNNSPSVDDLLEGVIVGIQNELMPYLSNDRALASGAMMQSLLQMVRQLLPVRLGYVIDEHNDMTRVLCSVAEHLVTVSGPEADRARERASTLGQQADLPAAPDQAAINDAHLELSRALEATIADLDVIQRGGGPAAVAADGALDEVRAHLAPRYLRDSVTIQAGDGFLGRG